MGEEFAKTGFFVTFLVLQFTNNYLLLQIPVQFNSFCLHLLPKIGTIFLISEKTQPSNLTNGYCVVGKNTYLLRYVCFIYVNKANNIRSI